MQGVEADAARRVIIGVRASLVARERLGRRGRRGHSRRGQRPKRLRVEGSCSGGEGVVARGKKKHAMPGVASSCGRGATGVASVTPCPHP